MEFGPRQPSRFVPLGSQNAECKSTGAPQIAKIFDPFFDIKVQSPQISFNVFNARCTRLTKTKIGDLLTSVSANTIFMGVVVESSGVKKSANGKDYLIWQLSDMQSEQKVKLLVFGDAVQACWKIQVGFVVAITHAEAVNDGGIKLTENYARVLTFKVAKPFQIISIGLCPDFGYCMAPRKNGDRCTMYVNLACSKVCVYHTKVGTPKTRTTGNSQPAVPKESSRFLIVKSPPGKRKHASLQRSAVKPKVMKREPSVRAFPVDHSMLVSKARLGHKMMQKLNEEKKAQPRTPILMPKKTSTSANNLKDFLDQKTSVTAHAVDKQFMSI
ncbi:Protein MCM10-like protein [Aphelenchoides bicaudatus]|nr:Protein MCM10-like protein [Aphelenchoides bicaudatus]